MGEVTDMHNAESKSHPHGVVGVEQERSFLLLHRAI